MHLGTPCLAHSLDGLAYDLKQRLLTWISLRPFDARRQGASLGGSSRARIKTGPGPCLHQRRQGTLWRRARAATQSRGLAGIGGAPAANEKENRRRCENCQHCERLAQATHRSRLLEDLPRCPMILQMHSVSVGCRAALTSPRPPTMRTRGISPTQRPTRLCSLKRLAQTQGWRARG